ncbi:MAG: Holliday junction resolvase RuvX [Halanaerobiaceae bacterium]
MRKMGLDIGDKRIGIAISDAMNITAQSKEVLKRTDHKKDLELIKDYIDKYEVEEIIVGLPKNMDGSIGPQAEKVKNYFNFLNNNLDIPIKFWDERLSTREAERFLIKADLSREKRKNVIDRVAAAIILQSYLNYQNNLGGNKDG